MLRRERELALARAAQTTQELAATRHEQRSEVRITAAVACAAASC